MTKIWIEVFWKNIKTEKGDNEQKKSNGLPYKYMITGSIILAFSIIVMGVGAKPIIEFCESAAADLLNNQKYINFVLG
jgi:multicomponent Na+:H+ antiporter subunit D